ncbi:hypothetical protein BDB01DRAFT_810349 [Pilobolus umbonatus]|nr:hypothetical protein BDB01DRAFT_810349 [Pilobolus umbonatus]
MSLASFPLIVSRWKKSYLYYAPYSEYTQLSEYMTEDNFNARLKTLNDNIIKGFPHIYIDSYLFLAAVTLVLIAAIFSIVARAVDLSLIYPLVILLMPIFITLYTTRRRNRQFRNLSVYEQTLQHCLDELNMQDAPHQIKWVARRQRENDTSGTFHLKQPLSRFNVNMVIDIQQIYPETAYRGEVLPTYDTSMMDIVLAIGPTDTNLNRSSDCITLHTLPPAYENDQSIELQPTQPPPVYRNETVIEMPDSPNRRT